MELRAFLRVEQTTPPRPAVGSPAHSVVRSYLLLRVVVGLIGMMLPVLLILGDIFVLNGSLTARGSLSAYYHSGVRDIFVGTLVTGGVFLVTYKLFRRSLDNTLSVIAGLAAVVVAMFPTGLPGDAGRAALTPLQIRFGEGTVEFIHFGGAFVFIGSLAIMSILFGLREGRRSEARSVLGLRLSPHAWRLIHFGCAAAIGLAVLFIAVTKGAQVFDSHSVLIGETVALEAFGISWFTKGFELDVLLA